MDGIVVGVDESSRAEAALRWAVRHAEVVGERVTAVMGWTVLDTERAAKVLADVVDRVCGPGAPVARRAIEDRPARAVLDAAADAALIVIGASTSAAGRIPVRDAVSRQVLRAARCPVAVVRDAAVRDGLPVVVGIDGSPPARRALEWGIGLARATGRGLVVLHAWREPFSTSTLYDPDATVRIGVAAEQLLHDELDHVDTTGLTGPVECRGVAAAPADALLDASATASVVVVGARGRGAIARALLGTVSDRVSHLGSAPTVVVP